MLARTAENLYWLARYVERAENIARLLDVAIRMTSMPQEAAEGVTGWRPAIVASGCEESFYAAYKHPDMENVLHHLTRDPANPSSILSCFATARYNARSVRTALTNPMWEAINTSWLEVRDFGDADFAPENIGRLLDWVKGRSLLYSGAVINTMLRNDGYWFTRLGTSIERSDNTARILDVKYHMLLPEYEAAGGAMDFYQWASILQSVSALRAYHWIYRDKVKPWLVAELLILKPEMPRSLAYCMADVTRQLDNLAGVNGVRGECQRLAGQIDSRLRYSKIDRIFAEGLHEFLTRFIDDTEVLGGEITKQYLI